MLILSRSFGMFGYKYCFLQFFRGAVNVPCCCFKRAELPALCVRGALFMYLLPASLLCLDWPSGAESSWMISNPKTLDTEEERGEVFAGKWSGWKRLSALSPANAPSHDRDFYFAEQRFFWRLTASRRREAERNGTDFALKLADFKSAPKNHPVSFYWYYLCPITCV